MDKTDRSILSYLQVDASLSVGDLADKVSISKSACWRRIQKLEERGVIRGKVTLLNANALGLDLTVFISVRTNQHNEPWAKNFRATVEDIPGVLEVYRMGGDVDYLIKALVQGMSGYDKLYQELIKADLYDVTASFVMEVIKETSELPL
ncbi:Lrp/AsnC family transcriptional regulator [Luminiphilus sp. nBUS_16]|uniref:Lrp/AsnC family transcriptional regulator n=1 Tax=Luminiphilus sp. nBUS_16 TaxID=3395315 RepID=UPI003EBB2085